MRAAALLVLLAAASLAGCSDPTPGDPSGGPPDAGPVDLPPLAVPDLAHDVIVLVGGPVMGAGEPAAAFAPDGTRYVAVTGCGDLPSLTGIPELDQRCWHSPVYRSDDGGATWTLLNQGPDLRLDPDSPYANADADVAVDAAGTVYVANLQAGGIHVHTSTDRGANWTWLGDLAAGDADRPWVRAGAAGEVVVTWHEGGVATVRASRDAGASWSAPASAPVDAAQLGALVLRSGCWCLAIPLVTVDDSASGLGGTTFALQVAYHDVAGAGDAAWTVVDTGARLTSSVTGLHTSGTLTFPSLARSASGTWALAWAEEQRDPSGASSVAARVRVATSGDGLTWTDPVDVTPATSAIMPWLAPGPGERFLLATYASDLPLDTDYVGRWDVHLQAFDAATGETVDAVVARDVHVGGICTRGTLCPAYASDRALLDDLQVATTPGGEVLLAFGADPPMDARRISIHAVSATWPPGPGPVDSGP